MVNPHIFFALASYRKENAVAFFSTIKNYRKYMLDDDVISPQRRETYLMNTMSVNSYEI